MMTPGGRVATETLHHHEGHLAHGARRVGISAFGRCAVTQPRAAKPPIGDREELLGLLWAQARRGRVTAMRLLVQELRREERPVPSGSGSTIDQLATRRRKST